MNTGELKQILSYYNDARVIRSTAKYHSLCGTDTPGGVYLAIREGFGDSSEWNSLASEDDKLSWIASGGKIIAARNSGTISYSNKTHDWMSTRREEDGSLVPVNSAAFTGLFVGTVGTTDDVLLGYLEWVVTMEVRGQQQLVSTYSGKILGSTNTQHSDFQSPVELASEVTEEPEPTN